MTKFCEQVCMYKVCTPGDHLSLSDSIIISITRNSISLLQLQVGIVIKKDNKIGIALKCGSVDRELWAAISGSMINLSRY